MNEIKIHPSAKNHLHSWMQILIFSFMYEFNSKLHILILVRNF